MDRCKEIFAWTDDIAAKAQLDRFVKALPSNSVSPELSLRKLISFVKQVSVAQLLSFLREQQRQTASASLEPAAVVDRLLDNLGELLKSDADFVSERDVKRAKHLQPVDFAGGEVISLLDSSSGHSILCVQETIAGWLSRLALPEYIPEFHKQVCKTSFRCR